MDGSGARRGGGEEREVGVGVGALFFLVGSRREKMAADVLLFRRSSFNTQHVNTNNMRSQTTRYMLVECFVSVAPTLCPVLLHLKQAHDVNELTVVTFADTTE